MIVKIWLSDRVRFVREPRSGIIFELDTGRQVLVNEDGAEIIEAICREDTEVLNKYYRENRESVASFLLEAKKRGYIEIGFGIFRRGRRRNCTLISYFIPIALSVEATTACNARCPYCYLSREVESATHHFIDISLLDKFLDRLTKVKVGGEELRVLIPVADLTGGEPLLHPRLGDLLEVMLKYVKRVSVLTNGILLGKHVETLKRYAGRISVQVSLDSLNPKVYGKAKGVPGELVREVVAAIDELVAEGVRTRVAVPVSSINVSDVDNTVAEIRRRWGNRVEIRVSPVLAVGSAGEDYVYNWDTVQRLRGLLEKYSVKSTDLVDVDQAVIEDLMRKFGNCGAGWKRVFIGADGYARPCPLFPRDVVLGSIRDEPSKVLGSPLALKLASIPAPGGEECTGCSYRGWCYTCPARVFWLIRRGAPCLWASKHNVAEVAKGGG